MISSPWSPWNPLLNFGSAPWQIHSKWSQILAIFSTSETLLLLNSGQMRASEKSFELDTSPEWRGCSLNCTGTPSQWTFKDEIRWDEGRQCLHSFPQPGWDVLLSALFLWACQSFQDKGRIYKPRKTCVPMMENKSEFCLGRSPQQIASPWASVSSVERWS